MARQCNCPQQSNGRKFLASCIWSASATNKKRKAGALKVTPAEAHKTAGQSRTQNEPHTDRHFSLPDRKKVMNDFKHVETIT